jgi:hypothetical protein
VASWNPIGHRAWGRRSADWPAEQILLPPRVSLAWAVERIGGLVDSGQPLEPDIRENWEQAVVWHRRLHGAAPYQPPPEWDQIVGAIERRERQKEARKVSTRSLPPKPALVPRG